MTEWKPAPKRRKGAAVPHPPCWSFRKQRLPYYCALQHEIAYFQAKFCVTFSLALV
jgi:hypothetical protein